MLQQVKDVVQRKIEGARYLKEACIEKIIKYVVKQKEKYNDLVGEDERIDLLDDLLGKLRQQQKGKKPKLG